MSKHPSQPPQPFEAEFIEGVRHIFEQRVAFNRLLGFKVIELAADHVLGRVDMRPELVGHFSYNRLHGGVISATLDAMAGLAVTAAIGARHMDEPPTKRLERFLKVGTIDLRIDYLRAGLGDYFTARAEVMRLGSRVATTRMEFRDAQDALVSTGTAAYIVS
ncbi:MAG: thioesterase family protein [Proteobacteria bacterium]|nr:thioesterase family protein [Pseudomonadota bacterium]